MCVCVLPVWRAVERTFRYMANGIELIGARALCMILLFATSSCPVQHLLSAASSTNINGFGPNGLEGHIVAGSDHHPSPQKLLNQRCDCQLKWLRTFSHIQIRVIAFYIDAGPIGLMFIMAHSSNIQCNADSYSCLSHVACHRTGERKTTEFQ